MKIWLKDKQKPGVTVETHSRKWQKPQGTRQVIGSSSHHPGVHTVFSEGALQAEQDCLEYEEEKESASVCPPCILGSAYPFTQCTFVELQSVHTPCLTHCGTEHVTWATLTQSPYPNLDPAPLSHTSLHHST